MPSTDQLYDRIMTLENQLYSLTKVLDRISDIETDARKTEGLLAFVIGFLLSPGEGKYSERGTKMSCRAMLKKWYYGGRRSKKVGEACKDIDNASLDVLAENLVS